MTSAASAKSTKSTAVSAAAGLKMRKETNLWIDAWQRLIRNKLAVLGAIVVLFFLFLAIFANVIAPYPYDLTNFADAYQSPNATYWFGTSPLGQDMFSRLIYGARISMLVGVGAQVIVFFIGVPLGAIAGYYGGKVDLYLMRFVDVMYAFPTLLFVILIMSALGTGLTNIFIAIGLTGWVTICRLTRGQFLSLREKEFVTAARAVGAALRRQGRQRPSRRSSRRRSARAAGSIGAASPTAVPRLPMRAAHM